MDEHETITPRREFLGLSALGVAAGVGALLPVAAASAATGPATPFTRWLDSISGKHRQVFDMREANGGMAIAWTWVYLLTGQQAYGVAESDLGAVVVLRHNAIPVALADDAWAKYKLGEFFKIDDPETGAPAVRNPFYLKGTPPNPPDIAIKPLMERGVKFAACDMAIFFYSMLVSQKMGLKHDDVKADWNAHVLPGIEHVPSGVVACNGAVARGCSYIYAG